MTQFKHTYTEDQKKQQGLECNVCAYANEHGWWGPDHNGTHCRVCHLSWSGLNEIHCVRCHRQFSNEQACDIHKNGIECLEPFKIFDSKGQPRLMLSTRERSHDAPVWTIYDARVEAGRLSTLRDDEEPSEEG